MNRKRKSTVKIVFLSFPEKIVPLAHPVFTRLSELKQIQNNSKHTGGEKKISIGNTQVIVQGSI